MTDVTARHRRRRIVVAVLLALAVAPTLPAQEDRDLHVELQLEPRDGVGLDELAVLRIKIEGSSGLPNPLPDFELDNFRIAGGPSRSTSLTIVNGVPSSSLALSWRLRPLETGTARVHGATVKVGDRVFELPERRVEVLEQAPPGRRRGGGDPFDSLFRNDPFFQQRGDRLDSLIERQRRRREEARRQADEAPEIFLRAEVEPGNPYVGEQTLYTLYLFTEVDVRSISPDELPDFKGFWSRNIPQPDRIQPELVRHGGERIYRFVLLQRALFPRRAGSFELPPVEASMEALVRDRRPFGSLLPRARQIVRESNPVTVEVRELPPAPPGYEGAVGRLDLTAELTPRELEVGEAATLNLTLSGRGHLQGIAAPVLPEIPGLRPFPPQQRSEETLRGREVAGRRSWSYVLVPERPGDYRLPPIEIPYFDPRGGRYRTAATEELTLEVHGSTRVAHEAGQTVELHPIRTAALPAVAGSGVDGARALPWLFAVPWLLGAAVLLVRWRSGAGGGDDGHARAQLVQRLRAAASEERPRQAAAEIEEAWRHYLEARWRIPPGTASPQWGRRLEEAGAPERAAEELVRLADDIHYLRYAPKLSSTDELQRELIARSRKLVRMLR